MKRLKWTLKKLHKIALKCNTRSEFCMYYPSAYQAAWRMKILDQICSHMVRLVRQDWTHEELSIISKKYTNRDQFNREDGGAYQAATLRGILDQICSHMPKRMDQSGENGSNFKWPNKKLHQEALKHTTRGDFQIGSPSAYRIAAGRGILDKICSHMKKSTGSSGPEREILAIVKQYFPTAKKIKDCSVRIDGKPHIKGFDIDTFVPELKLGIEFNGTYWHSLEGLSRGRKHWPKEDLKKYHQLKNRWFRSKGINILHIKQKDWISDKQACVDKLLVFLGINTKVAA
jgi:hypothetical protein